jgi:MarR family 2-MHQ and catechol resistance regulon transcriptional repressor
LSLTEQGKQVVAEAYAANEAMIHDQMSLWTKEEKKQLLVLLRKFQKEEK